MSPRSVLLAPLLLPLLTFAAGDAAAYTAYVTNEKDNTVSVVDLDKMETVKSIPVGERPRGILLSKDKKYIYICNGDADHIEQINLDTLQIERTLDSGPDPELFALDQTGNKLYIANEDNAMVTVLDLKPGSTPEQIQVGVEPEGMAVSPDDKYLVATSETTSMAHFIDLATLQVVASVLVDARPRFAAFTPDGKYVLVSSEIGGTVSVIDVATKKIVKTIGFAIPGVDKPTIQAVGVNHHARTARRAFVALGPANRVAVIDLSNFEVKKYLLVGQRVWHIGVHPRREVSRHGERQFERYLDHRRRGAEGDQIGARGTVALGSRDPLTPILPAGRQ